MRSLGVVAVSLLGLLSQEVSAGSSVAQINLLAAPQSRGTLAYVRDSAPPEFTYTTDYAQSGNWIGLFEKGMGPDTGGDDKYLGWASAPASKGHVTADADFDQCLPAGQYDAYLFRQRGPRSYPVVGPVTFSYPGNPNYRESPFLPQFNIDTLFGGTPVQPTSGTVGSIGWRNGITWITNQVLQPIPQNSFFMSWTGYLVPKHTGSYTFNMWWTDDVSYLWVGEHARSEFSESNADLKVDYASINTFSKKRFSYSTEQGKPVPIRVINVQAAGPYSLCFGVTDPTGQAVMNTCGEGGALRESDSQIAYCKDVKFGSVFRHVPNLYKFQPGSSPGHISYTSAQPLLPAHSIDMVLATTPNARYTGQVDKIGWDSGYVGEVDNVAFLWVGNKAIADFSETNADLKVDYAFLNVFGKKYFEYYVKAEDVSKRIPIKVANIQGGGAFSVFMMVTDPTGKVIMNSGDRGSGKLPQASNGEIGYCP
ncbi:GLEYA adhesin domain protein [Metarhizium brunneum]